MGKFGWSLPPGCTHRMIDDSFGMNEPCMGCGKTVDDCICEECPKCGEYGDPVCYIKHGMTYTDEQLAGQRELKEQMESDRLADDAMYEEYMKDADSILDEEPSEKFTYDDPEIFKGD